MIRVLVVDDSPLMCKILTSILNCDPQILVTAVANNGKEAVELVPRLKPDFITMDMDMPIMDGLKLVSMVRNDPAHKTIPIVIITTEGAEEDRKRGLALGANAYIPKPIQTADLLSVVNGILANK